MSRTLNGCREQLHDLVSAGPSSSDTDDVDSVAPEYRRHTHASYISRLCKDARAHSVKLGYVRRRKRHIEKQISQKRAMLTDLERRETDLRNISKKLKASSRRKVKLFEEISAQKGLLETLEDVLRTRLRLKHSASLKPVQQNNTRTTRRHCQDIRKESRQKKTYGSKRSEGMSLQYMYL